MRRRVTVDLAAAFLLSLLGGYCFAYLWRVTTFDTKRAEGHHLYFRAALCGAVLFALALCLRTLLASDSLAYLNFDSALVEYVRPVLKAESGLAWVAQGRRAEWVVTAIYSLLLGIGCGVLANLVTPRRWALRRSLSTFDRLLLRSYLEGVPVSLTLKTSKVYVGLVAKCPNPTREPVAVTLLPMLSGNRNAEGRMTLTTDYDAAYSALREDGAALPGLPADWASQIELQIRADEIVTAALFSTAIYSEFNPEWGQHIVEPKNQPPVVQVLSSIGTNLRFSGPM
jgi:hypothetical protein